MSEPDAHPDPEYRWRDLLRVPSLLSLARVPLAAVFPFVVDRVWWALAVVALAGVTDLVDGWWARRFRQTTAIGAVLDGATDKAFVLGVVLTLVLTRRLLPWQACAMGAREFGELILAAAVMLRRDAHARHEEQRADALGKLTTVAQFAVVVTALTAPRWVGAGAVVTGTLGVVAVAHYARRAL